MPLSSTYLTDWWSCPMLWRVRKIRSFADRGGYHIIQNYRVDGNDPDIMKRRHPCHRKKRHEIVSISNYPSLQRFQEANNDIDSQPLVFYINAVDSLKGKLLMCRLRGLCRNIVILIQ
jgi:hypothetical protein